MKNLLYHRVQPKLVKHVLESKSIKPHGEIEVDLKCVCMTRNVNFMSAGRPFVVVFDRDKLKHHFKIKPFCLLGWKFVNKSNDFDRWFKHYKQFGFESEERVYGGEIPLELAEYYGELKSGCYDYKQPKVVHSKRIYEKSAEYADELKTKRKRIEKRRIERDNQKKIIDSKYPNIIKLFNVGVEADILESAHDTNEIIINSPLSKPHQEDVKKAKLFFKTYKSEKSKIMNLMKSMYELYRDEIEAFVKDDEFNDVYARPIKSKIKRWDLFRERL